MTMEELMQDIKESTGKELGEFGFIVGTHMPVMNEKVSENKYKGYEIWKTLPDGRHVSKQIIPANDQDSRNKIMEFLNEKY